MTPQQQRDIVVEAEAVLGHGYSLSRALATGMHALFGAAPSALIGADGEAMTRLICSDVVVTAYLSGANKTLKVHGGEVPPPAAISTDKALQEVPFSWCRL